MKRCALLISVLVVALGSRQSAQIPLADVEIRLARIPHGGCASVCNDYRISVDGNGNVEYEGSGLIDGVHTRTVSPDAVVSLANEFLRARFFNAQDRYAACCGSLVRSGDMAFLYGVGSADDPEIQLTVRIGKRTKTVTLLVDYPPELGKLADLVDRIGGPQVWQ